MLKVPYRASIAGDTYECWITSYRRIERPAEPGSIICGNQGKISGADPPEEMYNQQLDSTEMLRSPS